MLSQLALPDPVALLDPDTGELVDLADAPYALIAQTLDDVDDLRRRLTSYRAALADEVMSRMDDAASWTVHAGVFVMTSNSPTTVEYDAPALWSALQTLAEQGRFGQAAIDRAVSQRVEFKVRANGITALRKLGPDVAQLIDAHGTTVDRQRSVRIARDL